MSDIRMTGEMRTDYDCETTGLPAEHWGEAVFKIGEAEIILEVSVEKDIIVAVRGGCRLERNPRRPEETFEGGNQGKIMHLSTEDLFGSVLS